IVLSLAVRLFILCFFFQAEDGIRHRNVTGVQTCALPILPIPPYFLAVSAATRSNALRPPLLHTTIRAPRLCSCLRRVGGRLLGTTRIQGWPVVAQETASAAPKLPELASTTGMPGLSAPRSVAKASIVSATPSLQVPVAPPKSRYAKMVAASPCCPEYPDMRSTGQR